MPGVWRAPGWSRRTLFAAAPGQECGGEEDEGRDRDLQFGARTAPQSIVDGLRPQGLDEGRDNRIGILDSGEEIQRRSDGREQNVQHHGAEKLDDIEDPVQLQFGGGLIDRHLFAAHAVRSVP